MIKANFQPLNEAFKELTDKVGTEAIKKATATELPRTLRQAKAQAVKHQESGLSSKGARGRIITELQKGRQEGVMGVRTNNDKIAAKHFKHKRKGSDVLLVGKKGFKERVKNAVWTKGRYTPKLLLQEKAGGVKPVTTTVKFDTAVAKTYDKIIPPALEGHVKRLMTRLIRGYNK